MKTLVAIDWRHPDLREGEIIISYISKTFFKLKVTWDTKRLGKDVYSGGSRNFKGKYPLFIQRSEAKDKGWFIH